MISRSFYNQSIFYIIYADIFILIKLCCSAEEKHFIPAGVYFSELSKRLMQS